MFTDDIVKIRFIKEGFLPDIPYHLVSDEEMISAFLNDTEDDFFHVMYPLVDESLQFEYSKLIEGIQIELNSYLADIKAEKEHTIPDWIYSYMLGKVIGPKSDQLDKHDLLLLLDVDNIDDEFNKECCTACYKASNTWLNKYAYRDMETNPRPVTIFGEPHVLKYLRLQKADALRGGN